MAPKKPTKPNTATLGKILTTMECGFAAVADDFAEVRRDIIKIRTDIVDIRNTMATKEDVADIRRTMATKDDVAGIMSELAEIKRRLKDIEATVDDHSGHSKEIDHALERIAAIEKHLGMEKKIAA